jgi:hypothetical protein
MWMFPHFNMFGFEKMMKMSLSWQNKHTKTIINDSSVPGCVSAWLPYFFLVLLDMGMNLELRYPNEMAYSST